MVDSFVRKIGSLKAMPGLLILAIPFAAPVSAPAQGSYALEEVIVTAQRREQSTQEVPISIEAVSGNQILEQGFRNMDDLADFSPSVLVNPNHLRNSITVRGFGASTADALTIEQSAPTFVDGVHFGRTNMIKLAFLDVERVEVLKGPQPVYFGQNAISGAFNITSRKPTPTWESSLNLDVGNYAGIGSFGKVKLDAGAGGPITDTLGIRIAGRYDEDEGYLTNALDGRPFPEYRDYGGRMILRWSPNDKFQATTKFEQSNLSKDSEGQVLCLTPGIIEEYPRGSGVSGFHQGLWADPPQGAGWDGEHIPLSTDCFGDIGRSSDGPFYAPPTHILEDHRTLIFDMREFGDELWQQMYGEKMTDGFEKIDTSNAYLDLEYGLDNGVTLSSLTAFSQYDRISNRENRYSPILVNIQYRDEDFDSFSQEFRISSPLSGQELAGLNVDWMLGAYYQDTNHSGLQDMARANTRRARRRNEFKEDATWKSLFGTVSFNFLDQRASIDIGARFTEYEKITSQEGWGASWIVDDGTPDGFAFPWKTSIDDPTHPLNGARVIGVTPWVPNADLNDRAMGGPYDDIANPKGRDSGTEFDPQITLRYRPNENHSVYAKYATSFKAGGADTAIAFVNSDREEFEYGPEFATIYEIGSKGTLWDGRMRYNVAIFSSEITDLQIATTKPDELNGNLAFGNAGQQSARGLEASLDIAATERLTVTSTVALLDSVMDEFVSTCTPAEFRNADTNDCISDAESIAQFGDTSVSGRIDRSGSRSANAPEWKVVMSANYEVPVLGNYVLTLNGMGFYSDGYLTSPLTFSRVISYDKHGDMNLQVGFGDIGGAWKVGIYGRNLFEHREGYHPEYVIEPEGLEANSMYPSSYRQYGLRFEYNYK